MQTIDNFRKMGVSYLSVFFTENNTSGFYTVQFATDHGQQDLFEVKTLDEIYSRLKLITNNEDGMKPIPLNFNGGI